MPKVTGIVWNGGKAKPKKKGKAKPKSARLVRGKSKKNVGFKRGPAKLGGGLTQRNFKAPAAIGSRMTNRFPQGSMRIKRTEFLETLFTQTSFAPIVYMLQPASIDNFPWLSQIAQNFEQYIWKSVKFKLKTSTASLLPGKNIFATQHDMADANFSSYYEMKNYNGAESVSVWHDARHNCMLRGSNWMKKYFTKTDIEVATAGQLYTPAKFSIAPALNATSTELGDLYVEYDIELFNPKMQPEETKLMGIQAYSTGTTQTPIIDYPVGINDFYTNCLSSGNNNAQKITPFMFSPPASGEIEFSFPEVGKYLCCGSWSVTNTASTPNEMQFFSKTADLEFDSQVQSKTLDNKDGTWTTGNVFMFIVQAIKVGQFLTFALPYIGSHASAILYHLSTYSGSAYVTYPTPPGSLAKVRVPFDKSKQIFEAGVLETKGLEKPKLERKREHKHRSPSKVRNLRDSPSSDVVRTVSEPAKLIIVKADESEEYDSPEMVE